MQLLSAAGSDYLGKLIPAFAPPPAPPASDQPDAAATSAGSAAKAAVAVGKDIGIGLTELPNQVAGGAIDFGNNLMKFADDVVKRAEEAGLPNIYFQLFDGNWAPRMLSTEEFRAEQAARTNGIFQVPTTGSAESVTGNIIRTGTTFLLGRGGLAKGGGVLANVGASGVSGALMDPREPRLSNLIDSIAPNFITDWLKARPDQAPGLLDRLKSAAEYAGLDLGFAGVTRVLRAVKDALADAGVSAAPDKGAAPQVLDAHPAAEPGVTSPAQDKTTAPGAQSAAADTRAAETAGTEAHGARTADATDQAAAGERAVPGAQAGTSPPLSLLPQARLEALRDTVQLPKFDREKNETSAILFTNEGKIIEFKSANPLDYGNYIGATHAEGKAAVWIRQNNSSGGVLFHNNPGGTCPFCNSHLETLLPEGARLWVLPPAKAVAKTRGWIPYPKPYNGNDAQPLLPNARG